MISIDLAGYIEYWDPETGGFQTSIKVICIDFPKDKKEITIKFKLSTDLFDLVKVRLKCQE